MGVVLDFLWEGTSQASLSELDMLALIVYVRTQLQSMESEEIESLMKQVNIIHFAKIFSKLVLDKSEVTFHQAEMELIRYMALEITWTITNLASIDSVEISHSLFYDKDEAMYGQKVPASTLKLALRAISGSDREH